MHLRKAVIIGAFALVGLAPSTAKADWLFTPFIGANFGGDTEAKKVNYGASFGYMGAGVFGFEVELAYSPDFFKPNNAAIDLLSDSNVTTLMGNVIVGVPLGGTRGPGVRPYATAGAGLMRTKLTSIGDLFEIDNKKFGVNVGGGVMIFVSDSVGLRGDVRYFRNITDTQKIAGFDLDLGDFNFWRATGGVVIRF